MAMGALKSWMEKDRERIRRAAQKKMAWSAKRRRWARAFDWAMIAAWAVAGFMLLSGVKGLAFIGKILLVATIAAAAMDIDLSSEDRDDAVHGMLSALDRNSGVLSVSDVTETTGEKDLPRISLGVFLTDGGGRGRMTVAAVQPESPAEAAGLQVGDRILSISGNEAAEKYYTAGAIEASLRHLETPKETLALQILRDEAVLEMEIDLQPWASSAVYDLGTVDGISHIAITHFRRGMSEDVRKLIEERKKTAAVTGVLFDFRGDPGGLVEEATSLASLFVPEGTVVARLSGRRQRVSEEVTSRPQAFPEITRIGVIQDGKSASASELFAAMVKDLELGPVGGLTSYGKGSQQIVTPWSYLTPIRLTNARFTGPGGTPVDGVGVSPDIDLEQDAEGNNDWAGLIERMREALKSR